MEKEATFRQVLRDSGERLSTPRLILFRALLRQSPLTTVRLVELAGRNGIDKSTTYRTLTLFRRLGVVRDIVTGGKRLVELSEDYMSHHHHFWCTKCGRLTDFDDEALEAALTRATTQMGVTIVSHRVEISGVCSDCRRQ